MTISQKLTTIAENQVKIFDTGKDKGYKEGYSDCENHFWDNIQNFGEKTDYTRFFCDWKTFEYIRPKYKVVPQKDAPYLFSGCTALKVLESAYFDFGQIPENYKEYNIGLYALCNKCSSLEYVEDVNFQPVMSYAYFFAGCENLKKIAVIRISEESKFGGTFGGDCFWRCYALEEVTFEGTIGNSLSVQFCPKLSHKTLINIIECLKDYSSDTSGKVYTLNLGKVNTAKLTEAEQQIAIDKGWLLA